MKSSDIYRKKIKKDNDKDKWLMICLEKKKIFSFSFILCKHHVDNNGSSS